MTGSSGPNFGISIGLLRVYPGGSETRHILATVSRLNPNTRAASLQLLPSTNTKRRTAA